MHLIIPPSNSLILTNCFCPDCSFLGTWVLQVCTYFIHSSYNMWNQPLILDKGCSNRHSRNVHFSQTWPLSFSGLARSRMKSLQRTFECLLCPVLIYPWTSHGGFKIPHEGSSIGELWLEEEAEDEDDTSQWCNSKSSAFHHVRP